MLSIIVLCMIAATFIYVLVHKIKQKEVVVEETSPTSSPVDENSAPSNPPKVEDVEGMTLAEARNFLTDIEKKMGAIKKQYFSIEDGKSKKEKEVAYSNDKEYKRLNALKKIVSDACKRKLNEEKEKAKQDLIIWMKYPKQYHGETDPLHIRAGEKNDKNRKPNPIQVDPYPVLNTENGANIYTDIVDNTCKWMTTYKLHGENTNVFVITDDEGNVEIKLRGHKPETKLEDRYRWFDGVKDENGNVIIPSWKEKAIEKIKSRIGFWKGRTVRLSIEMCGKSQGDPHGMMEEYVPVLLGVFLGERYLPLVKYSTDILGSTLVDIANLLEMEHAPILEKDKNGNWKEWSGRMEHVKDENGQICGPEIAVPDEGYEFRLTHKEVCKDLLTINKVKTHLTKKDGVDFYEGIVVWAAQCMLIGMAPAPICKLRADTYTPEVCKWFNENY